MSDINFTPEQAIAPKTAEPNTLTYVKDINVYGSLNLEQGKIYAQDNKIYSPSGKVRIPNAVCTSLYTGWQNVNATTSPTTINISNGQTINLVQSASTVLRFTGLPTEGIREFRIFRVHDATSNTYNLSFDSAPGTYEWYKEGRQTLYLSQTANAVDKIYGWVDSAGNVVTFNPSLNYSVASGLQSEPLFAAPKALTRRPRAETIPDGACVSTKSDLTLNATDAVYDGNETFTSQIDLDQVMAKKMNIRHSFATSSSTFTIDLSKDDFISLTHNSNIDTFDVIQSDPDFATPCIIWRLKDDSSTPRLINFSTDVFEWGLEPQLTQFNVGIDVLKIDSSAGRNRLATFNDFNNY